MQRPRIVLVEDSPADARLVKMGLEKSGLKCELQVIGDGERAIELFQELDRDSRAPPISLLLLDMHVPKRSGEEILKMLRSTERNAQTPVVILSGSDAPEDHAVADKHAALHYFQKPSNLAGFLRLGEALHKLVHSRKSKGSCG